MDPHLNKQKFYNYSLKTLFDNMGDEKLSQINHFLNWILDLIVNYKSFKLDFDLKINH